MEKLDRWEVKRRLRECRLMAYEVAKHMHITESALSKRLRDPSPEQVAEILKAIDEMTAKA